MPKLCASRLAVTLGLVLVFGACSSSKHHASRPTTSLSTTSVSTGAVSTVAPTTTSTVRATPTDPLPDAVLLGIHDRTIDALDAQGHRLRTLVTVFAGRQVNNALLMKDHETTWYSTTQGAPPYCNEIVKLDVRTNTRVVEAYANDFTLSADGSRLLLVWPKATSETSRSCPEKPAITISGHDALTVRDLRTGAESSVDVSAYPTAGTGGPYGHVWMSASGDQLVDSSCTNDPCVMRSITVPTTLGTPLVVHPFGSGPQCGCGTITTGSNGVYGIDIGSIDHRQTRLRRYDPDHLTGPGTVLVTPTDVTLSKVAPTSAGVYVLGYPNDSLAGYLYRFSAGGLERLRVTPYSEIFRVAGYVAT